MKMDRDHIKNLRKNNSIPKDHLDYLHKLKKEGFEPRVVYDIGSCILHWTEGAKKIWPDAHYFLFEANRDLEFIYTDQPYTYFLEILSDIENKKVKYYKSPVHIGGNSYYKENNDLVFNEDRFEWRNTKTLDGLVKEYGLPYPDLIKIDVQGSEIDILKGGKETIEKAKRLIVELQCVDYNRGAPKVFESLPQIEQMGWTCADPLFCNNGPDGDYGFIKC